MPSVRLLNPLRHPGGKGRMGALAEVFQTQLGPLDVEVSVEPCADGAGAGLHPLDRGALDEVPKGKYNQIRELDISSAFGLARVLLFRGREALPLRCTFLSEGE